MRQIDFLKSLEQLRFTGQLVQTDSTGQQWTIYFVQGQITYATGLQHPVRRWRRHLLTYCPGIPTYRLAWQIDLSKVTDDELIFGWEYALLRLWVTQQRITQAQACHLIRSTVTEVLQDILLMQKVTNQLYRSSSSPIPLELLEVEAMVSAAETLWQQWQNSQSQNSQSQNSQSQWQNTQLVPDPVMPNLVMPNPDDAPVVKQPEALQQWIAAHASPNLIRLLNGQRSLRDIATESKQTLSEVAALLLGCVQMGYIEFVPIPDLPGLVFQRELPKTSPSSHLESPALIACIDDSRMVRKMMEELLTSSGYQFLGIADPVRAIGVLLARKPQFIFLDLVMPNANGYEICEKLRKLSCFRHTPIVILTSNDGYANRLRSNFVGATDFLSKPLNAETVLSMVSKHLSPAPAHLPASTSSF
ncbi:MAG: response regulator [Elainella sp. Prado103]|nr:response regulator [Elainella sp. Prado103]